MNEFSNEELERYSRQIILNDWGIETQQKIKAAKVLVAGAGGLGCSVLQNLALTGIGTIGIIDFDIVGISNLQRQILYNTNDVGKKKAEVAAEKLKLFNPNIHTEIYCESLSVSNVLEIFSSYDIIVDGTDNFETRYLINDACVILNKPWVFGSIHQYEGQLSVLNYNGSATYRCLFPDPPKTSFSCDEAGVTVTLPLIIGNLQANEVVKMITGLGEVLKGELKIVNVLTNKSFVLSFRLKEENKNIFHLQEDYNIACAVSDLVIPISLDELNREKEKYFLIDVREEEEHRSSNIGGINVPVYNIDVNEINNNGKKILTYCSAGVMSKQAALLLNERLKEKIYYLTTPVI